MSSDSGWRHPEGLCQHSKECGFYLKNSETPLEDGSRGVIGLKVWFLRFFKFGIFISIT